MLKLHGIKKLTQNQLVARIEPAIIMSQHYDQLSRGRQPKQR